LVIAVAVAARLPLPAPVAVPTRVAVPQPLRIQLEKPLPRLLGLPVQLAPKTFLQLRQEVLELLRDAANLGHGVSVSFSKESASACQAKSQLTPSRFLHKRSYVTPATNTVERAGERHT